MSNIAGPYVMMNGKGKIVRTNQAFRDLIGSATAISQRLASKASWNHAKPISMHGTHPEKQGAMDGTAIFT
jgi:hypothetical protein